MTTREALQAELDGMYADVDIPGDWTWRRREDYENRRVNIVRMLGRIDSASDARARFQPKLETSLVCLDVINGVREKLCKEIIDLPKPKTEREWGYLTNLKISITCIDRGAAFVDGSGWSIDTLRLGALLREAGAEWQGSIPEIEARIKDAQRRVDDARAVLLADDVLPAEESSRASGKPGISPAE